MAGLKQKSRLTKAVDALSAAFPGWAEKRVVARHNLDVMASMGPGYNGGKTSFNRPTVYPTSGPEDVVTGGSYDFLVAACMNGYRNDPITRSIVDVVSTYMGESRPVATTDDPEFNKEATEYFNDVWWQMADARRRPGVDFGTIQNMWSKWSFIGGDMLFALHEGSLYPYEGLQVKTPSDLRSDKNVINGVRVEPGGAHRISHYYVAKDVNRSGYGTTAAKDFQRIAQSNAIFAPSKYWRASMLRGVPELHSVVDALADADKVNSNIQNMIKLQSSIWTIERKDSGVKTAGSRMLNAGSKGEQAQIDKASHGMRVKVNGNPKDDFMMNKMDNPGANHVPYMMHHMRMIAAGVGLPLEMVLHLFTNGSYTANRAARVDFAKFITDRWAWRNKVLNQRVWNWVIAKAIKEGRIRKAPVGANGLSQWHKCSWTLPYFPQIDEGKEIAADVRQWGAAVLGLEDIAQEQGRTRAQLLDAHDGDIAEMKRRAEDLGVTLAEYANEFFKSPAQNAEANRA